MLFEVGQKELFVLFLLVILLTIAVWGRTKELFVLSWLVILLTIVVWGRTEGVICIVVVGYIVDHCCLRSDRRSYLYCCGWLYCWPLLFEVGQKELFVLSWLVILLTIVVWGRTEGVICIVVVGYIVDHCCLRSDRRSYLYCLG